LPALEGLGILCPMQTMADVKPRKRVVIAGAGFAGLNAAKVFADLPDVKVDVIDQHNYHLFQPLLYQVATAGLNPADIAVPIRAQFTKSENIDVHLASVQKIDLEKKIVTCASYDIPYDYLILACGAQHSYFGHDEWEPYAPGLKTLEQATEIRRRILTAFETAEDETNVKKQQILMTFLVAGGGPTGCELAGAIADISRTVLLKDFRHIDPSHARVLLVEGGKRLLPSFPEDLAQRAEQDLKKLGVEVRTGAMVKRIDAEGVQVGDEFIPCQCVFWAAGVEAARLKMEPPVDMDKNGRIRVQKDSTLPYYPEVFVVGDLAAFEKEPGKILPGVSAVAIQSGRHAAENILRSILGEPMLPFQYFDKGQMATIGKNHAIAVIGKLKISGYVAWVAWLFVHVFYLVGFKNRIEVMLLWVWSYAFSKRGSRLITKPEWHT